MNELNTHYPKCPLNIALVADSWFHPFNGMLISTRRFVEALSEEFDFRIFIPPQPGIQDDEPFVAFPRLHLPGGNDLKESRNTPLAIANLRKILTALAGKLNFWISNRDQLKPPAQNNRQTATTRTHPHSTRRLSEVCRQTHAPENSLLDLIHD
ncbi:MAG: hypothetical protein HOL98_08430 [Gammaproteobacteria bacterium]|jgi:hypothetical protein|nr:hypothetical protein [Gammaproteobacteria bacterium]MBT5203465.1 hypothetical protein [Gammaproteobacteria bacterium]MBT5603116.1 hypothetical protein [Gammaproteobacteria bacterium]MBT6246341.1 hypothetical protein [Gammaproteobacteria bacterium]